MASWKHGKTMAGAVGYGATQTLEALGVIPAEAAGILKGLFAALFGVGARHAIEKSKGPTQ